MVREVIPKVVERFGADPRRVAIGGISMGGFGAFDIARLHPGRFCAVGGHSPALWRTGGETAPGRVRRRRGLRPPRRRSRRRAADPDVFSSAALARRAATPIRSAPATRCSRQALGERVSAHSWPGGHDGAYWNAH